MIDDKVQQPQYARDLQGMFQTVTAAPTSTPKNFLEQIQIYTSGTTYRIYWYDWANKTWHFVTATS